MALSSDTQREWIVDIINEVFAYPFMPRGFVEATPSPYPDGIKLRIGSRDVSFTINSDFMGQGTKLPEEWRIEKLEKGADD